MPLRTLQALGTPAYLLRQAHSLHTAPITPPVGFPPAFTVKGERCRERFTVRTYRALEGNLLPFCRSHNPISDSCDLRQIGFFPFSFVPRFFLSPFRPCPFTTTLFGPLQSERASFPSRRKLTFLLAIGSRCLETLLAVSQWRTCC